MEVYLIQLGETNKKLVPLDNMSNCHCKPCQKKNHISHQILYPLVPIRSYKNRFYHQMFQKTFLMAASLSRCLILRVSVENYSNLLLTDVLSVAYMLALLVSPAD